MNNDEIIKAIEAIIKRGNDVEIRRKGDGYIVLEVKKLDCTHQKQKLLAGRDSRAASAGADGSRPVRLYAGLGRNRR